jgi:hypothetical protein
MEDIRDQTDGLTDEGAARMLHAALLKLGVPCIVHWDRSPWGVAVTLVNGAFQDEGPTLYVLTENEFKFGQRVWSIILDGFGNEALDDTLTAFVTEVLQRGTFAQLASILAVYVELLRQGVLRTYAVLA